jgi:hypothetical protein
MFSRTDSDWANGQEARMRNRESSSWNVRSLTRLKSVLMVSSFMLFLSGSAAILRGGELQSARFEFALIGDMPYDARQEQEFANVRRISTRLMSRLSCMTAISGGTVGRGPSQPGGFLRAVTRSSRIVWV